MSQAPGPVLPLDQRQHGTSRFDVPSLVLAGLLLVLGVTLAVDASTIEAPRGGGSVGPAAFPWAVSAALLVLGVVLGLVATRGRPDEELASVHPGIDEELRTAADPDVRSGAPAADLVPEVPVGEPGQPLLQARPALRVTVFAAGLLAHALLISTAGYVVAALVLFVAAAVAFGAPRLVRVVVVGLVLTLVVFYSFTLGLGLSLPNFGGR